MNGQGVNWRAGLGVKGKTSKLYNKKFATNEQLVEKTAARAKSSQSIIFLSGKFCPFNFSNSSPFLPCTVAMLKTT